MSDAHTLPRSTWLLLLALTLGWGFNWPMMKIALAEIPVWSFRALCIVGGAAGLFLIVWNAKLRLLPPRGQWLRMSAAAMFNVTLWNLLIAHGITYLPAGRSVILAYTMPLWVVLLSRLIIGERLTTRRMLGLALGMSGMAVLIGHELALLRTTPIGAILVLGAALSWAIGTVLTKRFPTALPTTTYTGWQMLIGGVPVVIGALLIDEGHIGTVSLPAAGALIYNILIAFIFCHWAWFKIVSRASAGVSALGTLLVPVVGVLSSMVMLGERLNAQEYTAMALVILAIASLVIPARPRASP